jgi:hypothetical protein
MASAEIVITVAVEAAIHKSVRAFIEQLQAEHGLRITELSAFWHDASQMGKPAFLIDTLRIEIES